MKIRFLPDEYASLGLQIEDPAKVIGRNFPDFMIIGPQRTGTTWLSEMLRRHPNVHVSIPKEPHYFNNLIRKVLYKDVTSDFIWYLSLFDVTWTRRKRTLKAFLRGKTRDLGIVRGEATASTAVILTPELIRFIYKINPKIKIIYGLRNPVDRVWSHLKHVMVTQGGKKLEEISLDDMLTFCARDYIQSCGQNSKTIEKWLSVIPKQQFYCMLYQDMALNSERVLREVCHFLGIGAPSKELQDKLVRAGKINASEETDMPPVLRADLEAFFADEIAWIKTQGFKSFRSTE